MRDMLSRGLVAVALFFQMAGATAEPPNFAGPPPRYFVDESKLPFDALPGTVTTRYGVFTTTPATALRCPRIGTASYSCLPMQRATSACLRAS